MKEGRRSRDEELKKILESESPVDYGEVQAKLKKKRLDDFAAESAIKEIVNETEEGLVKKAVMEEESLRIGEILNSESPEDVAGKIDEMRKKRNMKMREINKTIGRDPNEVKKEALNDYIDIFVEENNKLLESLKLEKIIKTYREEGMDYFSDIVLEEIGKLKEMIGQTEGVAEECKKELDELERKIKAEIEIYGKGI